MIDFLNLGKINNRYRSEINERIANGDNSFTVDGYASDYNEFIKREYDKQIQEVEREYFNNVLYSKDNPIENCE